MYESRAKLEGSFFDASLSMLSRGRGSTYVCMVPCTPASYVTSSSSEADVEYDG